MRLSFLVASQGKLDILIEILTRLGSDYNPQNKTGKTLERFSINTLMINAIKERFPLEPYNTRTRLKSVRD